MSRNVTTVWPWSTCVDPETCSQSRVSTLWPWLWPRAAQRLRALVPGGASDKANDPCRRRIWCGLQGSHRHRKLWCKPLDSEDVWTTGEPCVLVYVDMLSLLFLPLARPQMRPSACGKVRGRGESRHRGYQEAHTALFLQPVVRHGGEDCSAKRQSLQPQDADSPGCTTHVSTPMAKLAAAQQGSPLSGLGDWDN